VEAGVAADDVHMIQLARPPSVEAPTRMPTCSECGSPVEPARQACSDCGARVGDDGHTHVRDAHDARGALTMGPWNLESRRDRASAAPRGSGGSGRTRLSIRPRTRPRSLVGARTLGLRYESRRPQSAALALQSTEPSRSSRFEASEPDAARESSATSAAVVPLRPDLATTSRESTGFETGSRPIATPGAISSEGPPARSVDTGSRLTPSAQSAARPPVLASEAMRRDLAPATPGETESRAIVAGIGLAGLVVALLLGKAHGLGIPVGGAFAALCVLSLVPLAYSARAAAFVTVAGIGLGVVTWNRLGRSVPVASLVPMMGAMLLATALLFRSWHRASLLARALVALGIVLCSGWVWMSGALHRLLVLEGGWQSWLPAVLVVPLAILLMLSLLAFMDSRATAGCTVWSSLLLGWYAAYTWSGLLAQMWPKGAPEFDLLHQAPHTVIAALSGPLFVVAVVIGVAQLLAVATSSEHSG
jgi:hypothetical protein